MSYRIYSLAVICLSLVATSHAYRLMKTCPSFVTQWVDSRYLQVFGDWCYFFGVNEMKTHNEARNRCQALGGYLAMPKTELMNSFITNQLRFTYGIMVPTWIGLHDTYIEGVFFWDDGTPLGWSNFEISHGRWFPYLENCVALLPFLPRGTWDDFHCSADIFIISASKPFVCQFPVETYVTQPNPTWKDYYPVMDKDKSKDNDQDTTKDKDQDTPNVNDQDTTKDNDQDTPKDDDQDTTKDNDQDTPKDDDQDTTKDNDQVTPNVNDQDTTKDNDQDTPKDDDQDTTKDNDQVTPNVNDQDTTKDNDQDTPKDDDQDTTKDNDQVTPNVNDQDTTKDNDQVTPNVNDQDTTKDKDQDTPNDDDQDTTKDNDQVIPNVNDQDTTKDNDQDTPNDDDQDTTKDNDQVTPNVNDHDTTKDNDQDTPNDDTDKNDDKNTDDGTGKVKDDDYVIDQDNKCSKFDCPDLDCGMSGFKWDKNACQLCECNF